MPLAACVGDRDVVVKTVCPQLATIPSKALDSLVRTAKYDRATGTWLVKLDKHYKVLDLCAKKAKKYGYSIKVISEEPDMRPKGM
jgi:hypothetical protein